MVGFNVGYIALVCDIVTQWPKTAHALKVCLAVLRIHAATNARNYVEYNK